MFKLVNYTEEITNLLNDTEGRYARCLAFSRVSSDHRVISITFFAVPDKALQPPKRRKNASHKFGLDFHDAELDPLYNSYAAELASSSDEAELFATVESFVSYDMLAEDDTDKEQKKKIIKAIVTAVLKYHILPGVLHVETLATNNTYSTGLRLHEGSLDSESLRVRISSAPRVLHPKVHVNFYTSILHPDVKTENGTFLVDSLSSS